jgi:MoaA/NifB/PqqE/SkfB family radical SAM enzyme
MQELGVKAVILSGGEPTLHRHFSTLAPRLLGMGFEVAVMTNGTNLKRARTGWMNRLSWLRVSVNAVHADVYEAVHGVKPRASYWTDIAEIVHALKDSECKVGSSFLVQANNIRQIYVFAKWSKEAGFASCRYTYEKDAGLSVRYSGPAVRDIASQISHAKAAFEDDNFSIFGLADRRDLPIKGKKAYSHCYVSDLSFAICPNGSVYRCCSLQNSPRGFLGSLKENSLSEIWAARGSQDVTRCPQCWQDTKNKFLEYAMIDDPIHVNFI